MTLIASTLCAVTRDGTFRVAGSARHSRKIHDSQCPATTCLAARARPEGATRRPVPRPPARCAAPSDEKPTNSPSTTAASGIRARDGPQRLPTALGVILRRGGGRSRGGGGITLPRAFSAGRFDGCHPLRSSQANDTTARQAGNAIDRSSLCAPNEHQMATIRGRLAHHAGRPPAPGRDGNVHELLRIRQWGQDTARGQSSGPPIELSRTSGVPARGCSRTLSRRWRVTSGNSASTSRGRGGVLRVIGVLPGDWPCAAVPLCRTFTGRLTHESWTAVRQEQVASEL
jgi:hypothetical protein